MINNIDNLFMPETNETKAVQPLKEVEVVGQSFTIYGTPEDPLFKAKDVATFIGHSDVSMMMQTVDDDEKLTQTMFVSGQNRNVWMLTENGLYEVLMQSRKPTAKLFKKGVKKILREIRMTGGYIAAKDDDSPEVIMAKALQIAQATLARQETRLKQLEDTNTRNEQTILEQAPKVDYYDTTLQSVNTMTTTQIAKELGMDAHSLNKQLKQAGVIFRQSGMWMLKQPYASWDLSATRTQTYTRSDGSVGSSMYTVWNERGRRFIHALHDNGFNARKAKDAII